MLAKNERYQYLISQLSAVILFFPAFLSIKWDIQTFSSNCELPTMHLFSPPRLPWWQAVPWLWTRTGARGAPCPPPPCPETPTPSRGRTDTSWARRPASAPSRTTSPSSSSAARTPPPPRGGEEARAELLVEGEGPGEEPDHLEEAGEEEEEEPCPGQEEEEEADQRSRRKRRSRRCPCPRRRCPPRPAGRRSPGLWCAGPRRSAAAGPRRQRGPRGPAGSSGSSPGAGRGSPHRCCSAAAGDGSAGTRLHKLIREINDSYHPVYLEKTSAVLHLFYYHYSTFDCIIIILFSLLSISFLCFSLMSFSLFYYYYILLLFHHFYSGVHLFGLIVSLSVICEAPWIALTCMKGALHIWFD